ncbi:2-isopropylmalate synthase [Prosthecochloris sp. N3]|uniref:2-isopropylmalate synthase n=1 Tax=Prosthecochloris ethylica TaxID=2743976 RepID=A0ABR9XRY5_9CHLB|nr:MULTISPECIES: 2-isopropylmalate synthase [Prosthecochloris]MEC9486609.1 2-isopropylmalate synthase [Prosthecochloris sp.]MBF0586783.1 2-isopropylmalate synthase [Prosthecochloris ethylica]MBF0636689.1 2-isopropylmalate synthase [Prosthecochloris ethylica]NUK47912.1 2-isopropylmalate synthase [Prosthecochloris ethylica]RNA65214.1 2-isopropylmalate synthase [Prosthecochloris sp. ZM_2]
MSTKEQVLIFDTTLRDGEQSPGASLSVQEKIEIARQLEKLNVDIIEAGFPASSPLQFEAVQRISEESGRTVAALSRAIERDIDEAWKALRSARRPRIHTFISTSDIHILGKFGHERYGRTLAEKRQTILDMAVRAVAYARTLCDDIEFSAEDAGRTDPAYLAEITEAVISAGAATVNIPDTTGYTWPSEFGKKIAGLRERVTNIDDAVISVHCHNDLGLAVANTISAIEHGARQAECSMNGIGERAGNASLEEIVMALKVRSDLHDYTTGITTRELYNTSRMVSSLTGIIVQPNKAIVGDNAFSHESGIHQDGMLKNRQTYEVMTPESVGVPQTHIVLGRHSGKHGLQARLDTLGYRVAGEELETVYQRFVDVADKKKEVYDDDLRVLMGDELSKPVEPIELDYLHINSGTASIPTATVRIRIKDRTFEESSTGDGPVDACFRAIERALGLEQLLNTYSVRSTTSGRQALGEATVRLKDGDKFFTGRGVSTDIIEASARAYLQALSLRENAAHHDHNTTIDNGI